MEIKIGGLYRHYKTRKAYRVIGIAKHTETLEDLVVYEAQYDNETSKLWARPKAMFADTVEWEGETVRRFQEITE